MKDNDRRYAVIYLTDLDLIDFSQIEQSSASTIRKSLDDTQFVIKWQEGYEPTFISDGKVTPLQVLTHSECLELMATSEWSEAIEIEKI
jgi:hypothetical protein